MSYQDSILRRFDSLRDQAKDALLAMTSCVCKPAATVKVNGRTCTYTGHLMPLFLDGVHANPHFSHSDKIIKALGEGGFSFVYLAQDEVTGVSNSLALVTGLKPETPFRRQCH